MSETQPVSGRSNRTALTITRMIEIRSGAMRADTSQTFTAMVNPSQFSQTETIRYNEKPTLGQIAPAPRFAAVGNTRIAFELLLDGTGAVPLGAGRKRQEVEEQVTALNKVVYAYNGSAHEPNLVRVLWGTLIFHGRLTSFSLRYTLFKPSGDPLRAIAALELAGYTSAKEAMAEARPSSPDLTHRVTVLEGDTLPLLCARIYGDPAYYAAVAQYNGLDSLFGLRPGSQLHFPPLG